MARLAHDTGIQGLDRQMTEYVCTRWSRARSLPGDLECQKVSY